METAQEKTFDWIKRCIETSTLPLHIEGCKKLIELYVAKFGENSESTKELLLILLDKENSINYM